MLKSVFEMRNIKNDIRKLSLYVLDYAVLLYIKVMKLRVRPYSTLHPTFVPDKMLILVKKI